MGAWIHYPESILFLKQTNTPPRLHDGPPLTSSCSQMGRRVTESRPMETLTIIICLKSTVVPQFGEKDGDGQSKVSDSKHYGAGLCHIAAPPPFELYWPVRLFHDANMQVQAGLSSLYSRYLWLFPPAPSQRAKRTGSAKDTANCREQATLMPLAAGKLLLFGSSFPTGPSGEGFSLPQIFCSANIWVTA
ncbi:hypothetical protein DdX_07626 [Ditylenchus destructor]|uniref:Uncharacterized protein n=1 Tax=Ditylenchus destructor TaxID=166010 RepID=A0AAD4N6S3_9BILA|nr:hypothetical protein DdX_07626 [Ditylenchus destructor]